MTDSHDPTRQAIASTAAPAAIGTYSQAIRSGDLVFLSGQIPLLPETGELVSDDFDAQAAQVLENLQAVCAAAGGGLNDCLKLTVYLLNLANFPRLNAAMESRFDAPYPARAAIGVADLPRGAQVEIEGIMRVPAR